MTKDRFTNYLINNLVDDSYYKHHSNIISTYEELNAFEKYMHIFEDKTFCLLINENIGINSADKHIFSYYIPIEIDTVYTCDYFSFYDDNPDANPDDFIFHHDEPLTSVLHKSNTLPSSDENLNIHGYHIFNSDVTIINNQLYKRFMPTKIPSDHYFDDDINDYKIYEECICSINSSYDLLIEQLCSMGADTKKTDKYWNSKYMEYYIKN